MKIALNYGTGKTVTMENRITFSPAMKRYNSPFPKITAEDGKQAISFDCKSGPVLVAMLLENGTEFLGSLCLSQNMGRRIYDIKVVKHDNGELVTLCEEFMHEEYSGRSETSIMFPENGEKYFVFAKRRFSSQGKPLDVKYWAMDYDGFNVAPSELIDKYFQADMSQEIEKKLLNLKLESENEF